ncbi:hypothetical protein IFM89_017855 [Coptis chinensis]|uniref:Amidase domain-containing protein n=1 Tax=Coptis chinensis TaxID=261450 RepID=A0A835I1Q2_9MAGN|nr:hypothetical protein IFM89_017855 [Coptis chinensis]
MIFFYIFMFMSRNNTLEMGIKRIMLPAEEVDFTTVKYEREVIKEPEPGVILMEEDSAPTSRVEIALKCLPPYNPATSWNADSSPFLYWKIRDFAHAYRSNLVTPLMVAEYIISAVEEFNNKKPPMQLLISFSAEDVRNQAAASTERFKEGEPLSILDGIFMPIKDDVDCYPHPTMGATTWFDKVRPVKRDAVCVSKLRSCGVILIGKANMHELGVGTTGNNPNYGTPRNPHDLERYTGGSSSGPAAIVAAGLCPAAIGTDGGGSIRIPSSLCGIVGLKTTYGRTDMTGNHFSLVVLFCRSLCHPGIVEIIGPIAATVEDVMLVYAAISCSSPSDRYSLKPASPCLPNLSSCNSLNDVGSLCLGKYTEWFNDVYSTEISDRCEDVLNMLSTTHGCKTIEVVIPELHEMRTAHTVAYGSGEMCTLFPDYQAGNAAQLTHDTRTNLAFFRSFSASDYVASGRLRRRIMYFHMEIFKKVDIIVTPTTGMTAPIIPVESLQFGETNLEVSAYLMRFIIAANLLGLPAISVPIGHDKQGLPIGLQLIGRPWAEATILRLASAIEELCAESRKRPSTFYDVLKVK